MERYWGGAVAPLYCDVFDNRHAMSKRIPLGPSLTGTLVAPDLDRTVEAYCDYLYTSVLERTTVSEDQALLWGKPRLAKCPLVTLESPGHQPWLRIIGCPGLLPARPFLELGWLALEILAQDVEALARRLTNSPFEVVRHPSRADKDGIRAMQVVGPTGEVLYLTELTEPVAPFDIEPATCPVERLFNPVSACLRRDEALRIFSKLGARRNWRFDSRLLSVNRAHGLDPSVRHPVATVQLAGRSTVEINQLGVAISRRPSEGLLPAGIAMVSFFLDNLDNLGLKPISPPRSLPGPLYRGQRVAVCRGAAGELMELIEAAG
jgi:hypothetical protein